jgi:hypothetical protein
MTPRTIKNHVPEPSTRLPGPVFKVTANASPGGVWTGIDSDTGLQLYGLADEAGEFHFLPADGCQYAGTAMTSGDSITGRFDGFAPIGSTFPDGSTHGTGTISGTILERASFVAIDQFTTDGGSQHTSGVTLTFNSVYDQPSSLTSTAGNWTDPSTGTVVNVNATGVIFAQDPNSGCILNGQVSIIDASYNAYRVTGSFSSCSGASAVPNGVPLSGLGTINTAASPEQFAIFVTGQSGGAKYALTYLLNRS